MREVLVPDIGDFKEVEVIEVLVKPGDAIAKEQSLITLESDKATMEIPSPAAGVVKEIKVKVGDKISQGAAILMVEEKTSPADKPVPEKKEKEKEGAPEKPAVSAPQTVTVPDIGDFKEVEVIEVLVKPGDAVAKEQSLITLESDKATMEIPSPAAGVVKEVKVKVGDKVSEGSPVLVIESEGGAPVRQAKPAPAAPKPESAQPAAAPA
ncbi:MAG: biotin/lipoyl-containing protein, partial [Burkholderiales bacterium]